MSAKLNNIAVLIDADNASANNIGKVLQEIEKLGHIACKKIYGDWGNAHIKSWQEALLKYAIDPMQHFAYVKGKNATDIGMVIEAMDLLYSDKYDGFCLVSSDSDFTSLALRIRKDHIKVFGFGKRSTVQSFTQACDEFYYVEDLLASTKTVATSQSTTSHKVVNNPSKQWSTTQLQTQTHLISALNKIIKENPSAQDGWTNLSYLASQLSQNYDNIKLDKYGYSKFSNLIIALRLYDIKRQPNGIWAKPKLQKISTTAKVNHKKSSSEVPTNTSTTTKDHTNSVFTDTIYVKIVTASNINVALFRVNSLEKVRGDEDMIFYGQMHSEDGTVELSHQFEGYDDKSAHTFSCDLSHQPTDIEQLKFALAIEFDGLSTDPKQAPIKLNITDKQQQKLFSGEFDMTNKSGKSLLLFTLDRVGNQWQFIAKQQLIDGDLRYLCEKYGVELSDA